MKKFFKVFLAIGFLLVSLTAHSAGISRSAFTTEIVDKEPLTELKQISVDVTRVYFFTEIAGLNGHTITHRWEYNGQVMAEVSFQVNANRWRTWSSKNLLSGWIGKWQVSVLDEGGNVIDQGEFDYVVTKDELQPMPEKKVAKVVSDERGELTTTTGTTAESVVPEQSAPVKAQ